ncbi:MAG: hypothetical protein HY924_17225 [Elusimicrobia bacterium]|nr:hypothetical protein [Elusimicrobiota bacterium]
MRLLALPLLASALAVAGCATTPERELAAHFENRHVQELVNEVGPPDERAEDGHGGEALMWRTAFSGGGPDFDPDVDRDWGQVTVWAGPDGRIYKWQSVTRGASGTTRLGTRSKGASRAAPPQEDGEGASTP